MKLNRLGIPAVFIAAVGFGLFCGNGKETSAAPDAGTASPSIVITGITRPSKELKLAFAAPGLVSDVAVKEGDLVGEKQILASQDSRQDVFALKSMQSEADSIEKITYSIADRDLKVVKAKRTVELFQKSAASQSETEEADLAVKLAEAQIALAKLEHDQKIDDASKQAVKVEQMQIASPIKGIVEKLNVGPGEMADPQSRDGAIVVGQWDPLWLEVHLPSSQASQLKMGDSLGVSYDGTKWEIAKIIYFEKVDAASDTEMVRMEMANPGNERLPGLHMQVKLPENVTAVAAN